MDFNLTPHQLAIADASRAFARNEILPYLPELEEDPQGKMQLYEKMAIQGLFQLSLKQDSLAYALALKEIAKVDAGISVAMAVTNMVAEAIHCYGSESQKNKYLDGISKGTCVPAAFALTEELAGSDAKSIKMQAVQEGDSFLLDGEKHLISNGDLAGVLLVLAKIPDAGIAAFLVEKNTPGLSVIRKEQKLGLLTAHLVRLKFDRCRVPASHLLGKPYEGLKIALGALDSGRIGIAAQSLGIAEAAFESALCYAETREQFGEQLLHFQAISFKLADMKLKLTAGELLLFKACWMLDTHQNTRSIAAQAKLFNSEAANEIASEALQIFGGYGYIKSNPVEKYFRDARATTIYEGTSEIQRLVISRHLWDARG